MSDVPKRPQGIHPAPLHWAAVRATRLVTAGNRCETCNSPDPLDCHHRTYERWGVEAVEDVLMLCRFCHDAITSSIRERRYAGQGLPEQILIRPPRTDDERRYR